MPDVEQFLETASNMAARTVTLSGDSSAVLFSALAALNAFWQWTSENPIDPALWDEIQAILDRANYELMTPQIGNIVMYTTADPPAYSLPCDGGTYAREDYANLYAVLDSAYIIDGDSFVTPSLNSRSPIGAGEGAGLSAYTVNQIAGEENHELIEDENATHAHIDSGHSHFYQPPGTTGLAVAPGELPVLLPSLFPASTSDSSANISSSGLGAPHNTIHPVNAVKFAVYFA